MYALAKEMEVSLDDILHRGHLYNVLRRRIRRKINMARFAQSRYSPNADYFDAKAAAFFIRSLLKGFNGYVKSHQFGMAASWVARLLNAHDPSIKISELFERVMGKPHGSDQMSALIDEDLNFLSSYECRPQGFARLVEAVRGELQVMLAEAVAYSDGCEFSRRMDSLCDCLRLSKLERDVLELQYLLLRRFGPLGATPDDIPENRGNMRGALPYFVDADFEKASGLLLGSGKLIQLGLLYTRDSIDDNQLTMSTSLLGYLTGEGEGSFLDFLFESANTTTSKRVIGDLDSERRVVEMASKLLRSQNQGANLLFFGAGGLGKTSFVESLVHQLGLGALKIKVRHDEDASDRITNLLCAVEYARQVPQRVVVVDEADSILKTSTGLASLARGTEKAVLNQLLDQAGGANGGVKVIWIANSIGDLDESVLRRFAFSHRFEAVSRAEKLRAWRTILERHPTVHAAVSASDLSHLASRFDVVPGVLATAAEQAAALPAPTVRDLELLLASYLERRGVSKFDVAVRTADEQATRLARFVNAKPGFKEVLAAVETVMVRVDAKDSSLPFVNMHILLHGGPGSGKTAFATALALELGRALQVRRPSDILSSYVGGTERNIAAIFKEAERTGAVLFIDEADSLWIDRSAATRSWEISQTNELLTQMEAFRGILLCATNRKEAFDAAAHRRFAMIVEFDVLAEAGKAAFYRDYLESLAGPFDDGVDAVLKRLSLVPGDFKCALQQICWRKASAQEQRQLAFRTLETASELRVKGAGRPVGFGR